MKPTQQFPAPSLYIQGIPFPLPLRWLWRADEDMTTHHKLRLRLEQWLKLRPWRWN